MRDEGNVTTYEARRPLDEAGERAVNMEQRLSELERRFQIMADAAPVLLWMSREDSMCTFFNQTWLDFSGRTQEEEWGIGWAEGVHPEELERVIDTYQDAFNERRAFEMEYRLRRADGEYRWLLDRGVPRYTADGIFAGYIGSCVDITDRKTMEADLRRALSAKDEFLGMVSHELRTPMASLVLQLERLRRNACNFDSKQLEVADRMARAVSRLGQLVESVLQFSRIDRGRLQVDTRAFDLRALLTEVHEELRPLAELKQLELRLDCGELPLLYSDPELVRLIVVNLIQNALKFTERGVVDVIAVSDGATHRVVVRDTGRGIPADQQARIFDPFEQLEPHRGKHTPGVGLGLSLVKAMSAALRGHIELESSPGLGSKFTLVLPSSDAERP